MGLVLGPLGTAAVVLVFVVFMLLEREDLRDRLIRLVSHNRYTVTTRAIDDAAGRISRYMLAQSMVNGSYGVVIGTGLFLIGLTVGHGVMFPSFVLWGLLSGALRFIPYIGAWIAASFPILLSLAVYPGFGVFVAVLVLLVGIELITNNVMEPLLYSSSTGLSTMAILIAAVFWTWLWGPVGLLLSTPLTVCVVVLGKHVTRLKFLDVLLGDQAALPPAVSFYQRLLASDRIDAISVAKLVAKERGAERVADEVLIPTMLMAKRDRKNNDLSAENENKLLDELKLVLPELRTDGPKIEDGGTLRVLGVPAHQRSEELVLEMLGDVNRAAVGAGRCTVHSPAAVGNRKADPARSAGRAVHRRHAARRHGAGAIPLPTDSPEIPGTENHRRLLGQAQIVRRVADPLPQRRRELRDNVRASKPQSDSRRALED